jgi:hypothetical protein
MKIMGEKAEESRGFSHHCKQEANLKQRHLLRTLALSIF